MIKKMMNFIIGLCLFYGLFILALFVMQRSLIYFPDRSRPQAFKQIETATVTTQDGLNISGWFIPVPQDVTPNGKTILMFHGNAGHYGYRYEYARILNAAGYNFLIAGYRGYGGNTGDPSEQGFYIDGHAYIEWLRTKKGIYTSDLVILGESIGSGTATQMAVDYDVYALVLLAPFTSLLERAKEQYFFVPVEHLLKDKFDNAQKMPQVSAPVLIVHGQKDQVIPVGHGKKLYDLAKEPKVLKTYAQANHNDLLNFSAMDDIISFLSGLQNINSDNE